MIVKNEAKNIGRCLDSIIDVADEIIVVDTGSIDNTKEIAKKYGAKVYDFKWVDDFSKARNYSLSKATGKWILILDGDDEFEKQDLPKLLDLIKNPGDGDIFVFNTICYVGQNAGNERIMNVNIRLFKNKPSIRYQGRIHEGIIPQKAGTLTKFSDIRIYHYGYLDELVIDQNKRERNMRLLEKELELSPDNSYWLFCMGNEYFALNQLEKALEYYLPSYEKSSNKQDIYVPKTIIRIIMIYDALGKLDTALKYIDEALGYYPQYTDVEFLRGGIYQKLGYVTKAIRSFQRCLELGEPPSTISFLMGVGSYKAHYALGNIFNQVSDYEEAVKYYNQALLIKNDFYDAIIKIGEVFTKIYKDPLEIKANLEKFFDLSNPLSFSNLEEILFCANQYQLALNYANLSIENNIRVEYITFKKAMCLYNLNRYEEAINEFTKIDSSDHNYLDSQSMLFNCYSILNNYEAAENILPNIKQIDKSEYIYKLLICLNHIFQAKDKIILSEDDKESSVYLPYIINELEAFLRVKEIDKFQRALELFNCIENKDVLLSLGKLYAKLGFMQMAAQEIKRSICIFDKLDLEAVNILQRSFLVNE